MTRKKVDEPTDPAVKHCIDRFHDGFLAKFGFKPDPRHFGRFGKELKPLLAAWGEAEVLGAIDAFFATTDPRIVRSDYTVMAFLGLAQHLRVRRTGRQPADERTASNVDAVARATGRR
jgi:hypothetical protein